MGRLCQPYVSFQFAIRHPGGRPVLESNTQSAAENIGGPLHGAATAFTIPSSGDVFTYSFAPRWHVDANTMVYARVATGYRPGGPNAEPIAPPPGFPKEYGADKTVNFELGVRSTQLDGRLSIDVAAFHAERSFSRKRENRQSRRSTPTAAKARNRRAWNWTFAYVPVHGLTLGMLKDINNLGSKFDSTVRFAQIFGIVAFIGGFGVMLWHLRVVWSGNRRWPAKVWSIVLALSAFFVLWVAFAFKLLGFGLYY